MDRMLTQFESRLKNTIERHEAPYNEEGWKFIEQHLTTGGAEFASRSANWVAWLAASLVVGISSWLVYDYHFDVPEARLATGAERLAAWYNPANENSTTATDPGSSLVDSNVTSQSPLEGNQTPQTIPGANDRNSLMDSTSGLSANNVPQQNVSGLPLPGTPSKVSSESAAMFYTSVRNECAGNPVVFKLTNNPGSESYLWNFGDGTFSSQPNPEHIYTKPGVYDISLSITNADGLIKSTIMEDLITINPTPESEFEWDFVSGATDEPTVKFVNLSENATEFSWTFDEKTFETEISPVKSYVTRGKHSVELYVENEFGCSDVTVRYLTINSDYNLLAPPNFSPNADGLEDTFMPEALKENNFNFSLTVYDGSKPVFNTISKNKPWNGKLKDGSTAPVGASYPWVVIIYNSITKEEKYFSGSVTVAP